ncbi:MAG: formylglycine-generating enzyme family protein [Alphaproteobacteria bacterium]|nr:formylglycine-generating enzyme family protein [Alphaproteobacteria bacterium]
MLDTNTAILVGIASVLAIVGGLAWLIDNGYADKARSLIKYTLFASFAAVMALFFMIDDDSELGYAMWTPAKLGGKGGGGPRKGLEGGEGGGGGGAAMVGGSGGGGGDLSLQEDSPPEDAGYSEGDMGETTVDHGTGPKQDCPSCPEIVTIQPGQGLIGSSAKSAMKGAAKASRVSFKREFGIGKFEITVEQFEAFTADAGYTPKGICRVGKGKKKRGTFRKPGFPQTPTHPAVCLNFKDALAYTQWLSEKTGHTYRLPTEMEWEYAARAGVTNAYLSPGPITGAFANFSDKKGPRIGKTTPVGSYSANGNDMHDVHGNAWEMTADCWSKGYLSSKPGANKAGIDCTRHVAKGGAWYSAAPHLNFAMRVGVKTNFANNGLGFRVVRESGVPLGRKSSRLSNAFKGENPVAGKTPKGQPEQVSIEGIARGIRR